jgi:hypothetical protein
MDWLCAFGVLWDKLFVESKLMEGMSSNYRKFCPMQKQVKPNTGYLLSGTGLAALNRAGENQHLDICFSGLKKDLHGMERSIC